ncbi:hypothetical protein ACWEPC_28670 [Nonomuraea sp. NPDC004297]
MHRVFIVVDTPGWRASGTGLRTALSDSATRSDRMEHVFTEVWDDLFVVVLYLGAVGVSEARLKAEQLCRRAMAVAVPPRTLWMIRWMMVF